MSLTARSTGRGRLGFAKSTVVKISIGSRKLASWTKQHVIRAKPSVRSWAAHEVSSSRISHALWFSLPLLVFVAILVGRLVVGYWFVGPLLARESPPGLISLLSALAQVLASVFAIVFAVALLLLDIVDRRYNNPSLLRVYLDHRTIIFFPGAFLWALLWDLLVLANASATPTWITEGAFLFALVTIFLVYFFVRTTARFLQPTELLKILEKDAIATWRYAS